MAPHLGLLLVIVVALTARLIYLRWFKAFPPGDVFNFINIARAIPEGDYPPNERRLPFYPLLILLARSVLDWEPAALAIAIGASLAGLALLYALGRTLGLTRTALVALLLVVQVHPQLMLANRGYADTTMFALLPATLLAIIRTRTWKGALLTGLLCGAMALTRYEGTAAALAIIPLWFLFPKGRPRRYPAIAALAFVLSLLPYTALSLANDRPIFGAGYIAEADGRTGYGSGNIREFWESALGIWRRNGLFGAWEIPRAIVRETIADPFAAPRILVQHGIEPGEPLALLALLGLLAFLFRRQWQQTLYLLTVTAAATAAPAWFNPLPRYDIVVLPLLTLLAASGVTAVQRLIEHGTGKSPVAGTAVRWLAGASFFVVAAGVWMVTNAEDVRNRQQKRNGAGYAYYQAIHAARALEGKIAYDRDPDIVRLYMGNQYVLFREPSPKEAPTTVLDRLREADVRYLVLPNPETLKGFAPVLALPEVKRIQSFEWLQGNNDVSRAAIYHVR